MIMSARTDDKSHGELRLTDSKATYLGLHSWGAAGLWTVIVAVILFWSVYLQRALMDPLGILARPHYIAVYWGYAVLWLIGLAGIVLESRGIEKRIRGRTLIEKELWKQQHILGERGKELNFLHGVAEIAESSSGLSVEIAQGIVDLIPQAWQYPKISCARIILEGQEFKTVGFGESEWMLSIDILTHGEQAGSIQVYFSGPKPSESESLISNEERQLLETVAKQLGKIVERKRAKEALVYRLHYEEMLGSFSQELLKNRKEALKAAVSYLLKASGASGVYIYENFENADDGLCMRQIAVSCAPVIQARKNDPRRKKLPYKDWIPRWQKVLAGGDPINGTVEDFPQKEREILEAQDIQSILILPIFVNGEWFGFLGFDDTLSKRKWDRNDIRLLQIAADRIETFIVRKRAEEALSESEKRYRSIFDESKDMILISSVDGKLIDINPAGAELLGYSSPSELINTQVEDFYYNRSDREHFKRKMAEGSFLKDFEIFMKKKDGSPLFGLETSIEIKESNGNTICYQSIVKDITERIETEKLLWRSNMELVEANAKLKQTQSQLVQQEKLASLGQLAAGVAHEINNPLGFIKSNYSVLKQYLDSIAKYIRTINKQLKDAADQKLDVDFILNDIEALFEESNDGFNRIITIVQNLKDFSRVDFPDKFESYDLQRAIESTLIVAKNEYKYVVEIEREYADIPLIECMGSEINQVLLNLIVNAAQAIESQKREDLGIIHITTRKTPDHVVCEISDDGPGIPTDIQRRIFEPFYSTKEAGKGTGLGLSISYDIVVNKHGGDLTVESEENRGSTFIIKLPIRAKKRETENGDG